MPIETANYVADLNASYPQGTDKRSTADNHDRLIKSCLLNTFSKLDAAVSASAAELNLVIGATTTDISSSPLLAGVINAIYPVGSIYIGTSATNPGTLLGVGTWTAFGQDRVLISAGSSYAAEATGGSANATLVHHTHTFSGNALPAHDHATYGNRVGAGSYELPASNQNAALNQTFSTNQLASASAGTPSGTISSAGASETNANLPPYIGVYMWKRTA